MDAKPLSEPRQAGEALPVEPAHMALLSQPRPPNVSQNYGRSKYDLFEFYEGGFEKGLLKLN